MRRWVDSSPLEFVKLNAFQQVMRRWDELHPYNAVQAARVVGQADVDRLNDAWRAALKALGIGRVIVRGDEYAHTTCLDGDPSNAVHVVAPGTSLDQFLTDEMNAPMSREQGCPFRPFVLRSDGSYFMGINYHHWVADSYSVRWVMREWFSRFMGMPVEDKPAIITDRGPWHYFGPRRGGWNVGEGLLALLRRRSRFARARLARVGVDDGAVSVSFHGLPDGIVTSLARLAHSAHVTLNDVLLSVIAQAVDRYGANPVSSGRDELAVGAVVDLRPLSDDPQLTQTFGLYLGTTTTIIRAADLRDWPRLLRSVARQNRCQKLTCAPQISTMLFAIGLAELKRMKLRRWAELYRRRMPVAAGISNVNMNRHFAGQHHPSPILDYVRVAPTGPMLPLLVTTTTLGANLNFTLTRQRSAIDDAAAQKIVEFISNHLIQLAANVR
jgi:NRPS condensation-like uncharacterized protein